MSLFLNEVHRGVHFLNYENSLLLGGNNINKKALIYSLTFVHVRSWYLQDLATKSHQQPPL